MKFSYNWLKDYLEKIPEPQQLADVLTMRIFEVEEVKKAGDDFLLDIKILPNRAVDCMSHLGIAREIAAITKTKFKEPIGQINESHDKKTSDYLAVEVKEKKLCPRYSGRVVLNIKVGESPEWLKNKLETCGLRPINNIVDITNFVMLETGQPLHAFDLDKISDGKIIVRRAKKGEKIITLDEGRAERELNDNILVIADKAKPIAIAGIKGGRGTEIETNTKNIIIEAANFEAVNIRKSSKALNLRTDASIRFENRPDINLTLPALERCAMLVKEIAGGEIAEGAVDVAATAVKPWNVGVEHDYIESLLGVKLASGDIMDIFEILALPAEIIKKDKSIFYEILAPTRRSDLQTAEDLIEEIGRFYGYENIKPVLPNCLLIPALKDEQLIYVDKIKSMMQGFGYSEVYNYSFISEDDKEFYGLADLAEVLNPYSRDQKYLRPNLAVGFIKNIQENKPYLAGSRFVNALRLFEIGDVFFEGGDKIVETRKFGGLLFMENKKSGEAFYELKGVVETLFDKLGLSDVWEDDYIQGGLPINFKNILQIGKVSQIKIGDKAIGWLGKINEDILERLEIKGRVAIFEINFTDIISFINEEREYEPPSKFPAITRDLAVLSSEDTKVENILNVIEGAGGGLLDDVNIFDIYENDKEDIKSFAFHLVFQSYEKNLTDSEVNKLMEKIIKAIEDEGWEVKK